MDIKTIGIIGAGQMGSGIAYSTALAGYQVLLFDISYEQVTKAISTIEAQFEKALKKNFITLDDKIASVAGISGVQKLDDLKDCHMVIEAASEKETIKQSIFKSLCEFLPKQAYIVSNTSSISITRLASYTDRPERFMGVHFMNPVPIMQLVELVRGIATGEEIVNDMKNYISKMGKTYAQAEDFPAFIVNRILIPMINEAVYTLYEGVGTVKSIDACLKMGANHPMGPLQLADFIGLDTCLAIMQVLNEGLADTKYRPCPLLVKYVEAGWLGRKTGKGFYDYSTPEPTPTR